MKKLNIAILLVLILALGLVGCQQKKADEVLLHLENGDYLLVEETYLSMKNEELIIQLDNEINGKIDTFSQEYISSKSYQELYDFYQKLLVELPSKTEYINGKISELEELLFKEISVIEEASMVEWAFKDSIVSLEILKEQVNFINSTIETSINSLESLDEIANFCYEALDNSEKGKYKEALDLLIENESKEVKLSDKISRYISEVLLIYHDHTYQEIESSIKTNSLGSIDSLISDYSIYDDEGAKEFETSINEMIPETITVMVSDGKYKEALQVLSSVKTNISSLSDYAVTQQGEIELLLPSVEFYESGIELFTDDNFAGSIAQFNQVHPDATYYYDLAITKKNDANTALYNYNLSIAKDMFSKKKFDQAISSIDNALGYKYTDVANSLRDAYITERALYKEPHEIFDMTKDAVVLITSYDDDDNKSQGSGFIISSDGKILTNYHVIETAISSTIKLTNGETYDIEKVLYYNIENDYAVIKIAASGLKTIAIGNSNDLLSGERIVAIGNPKGLENTISEGLVSSKSREIDDITYIQISAPISPGSSGGALLNLKGEAVGITTAYIEDGQNLNLAVPINTVSGHINDSSNSMTFAQFTDRVDIETIYFSDENYYVGETKRGVPNGTGIYTNGDFFVYEGDVVNQYFEGNGTLTYDNGNFYVGEFLEDQFHGTGTYTYASGGVISGIWEYGNFMGEALDVPQNLTPYLSDKYNTVSFEWDRGSYDSFSVYYSYDLVTWTKLSGTYAGGSVVDITIDREETFVYIAVTGYNGGVESKKSKYLFITTKFRKLDVYSNDGKNVFLGSITSEYEGANSILSDYNQYGSFTHADSIWNEDGIYGSDDSNYSAYNEDATKPPVIKNSSGEIIGYLTINGLMETTPLTLIIIPSYIVIQYIGYIVGL